MPNADNNVLNSHPLVNFFKKFCGQSSLIMIESTAYFESYYHVLKKLQEMGSWPNIPF